MFGYIKMKYYAVTGTNGKSSVVFFLHQILTQLKIPHACECNFAHLSIPKIHPQQKYQNLNGRKLGKSCGYASSRVSEYIYEFNGFAHAKKVKCVAFEAYSSSIKDDVYSDFTLNAAGFTNLSRDHLDDHGDMESYFQDKLRLFTELNKGTLIINKDCPYGKRILELFDSKNCLTYGTKDTDILLTDREIIFKDKKIELSKIPIKYDIFLMNLCCSIGFAYCYGISIDDIFSTLPNLTMAPGRMELMHYNDRDIIIDYAKNPKGLEAVLKSVKTKGRKILLFGCSGDRDPGQRKEMGAIAEKFADVVIVTDKKPKGDDPENVRNDILEGCPQAFSIANREEAIIFALDLSQPGDVVLLVGMGHRKKIYHTDFAIECDEEKIVRNYFGDVID